MCVFEVLLCIEYAQWKLSPNIIEANQISILDGFRRIIEGPSVSLYEKIKNKIKYR